MGSASLCRLYRESSLNRVPVRQRATAPPPRRESRSYRETTARRDHGGLGRFHDLALSGAHPSGVCPDRGSLFCWLFERDGTDLTTPGNMFWTVLSDEARQRVDRSQA